VCNDLLLQALRACQCTWALMGHAPVRYNTSN
jgi:hypothetical protein